MTTTDVVNVYNIFAKQQGTATVKKFRDRETGHKRLQDITRGKDRRIVVAAMKEVGMKPEIIKLLPDTPAPVAAPSLERVDEPLPKKVDAAKVLSEAKTKESARQEKDTKKTQAVIRKELKLTDSAAEVFRAIRETCTNRDKEVTTTELAKTLKTGWPTISKAIESLKKLSLIKVEDDSPDDDNPLWYISVTRSGLDAVLPKATGAVPAGKKSVLPGEKPGPRSSKNGMKIHKLVDANPRREGTHGYKSFALIKNGMTYEEYIKAGGRPNDLAWDIDHKYVELR